jgi:hypothetical protein
VRFHFEYNKRLRELLLTKFAGGAKSTVKLNLGRFCNAKRYLDSEQTSDTDEEERDELWNYTLYEKMKKPEISDA